jgi:hypothetical protein
MVVYTLKAYMHAILGDCSIDSDLCSKNVMNNVYIYGVDIQVSRSSAINLAYLDSLAH